MSRPETLTTLSTAYVPASNAVVLQIGNITDAVQKYVVEVKVTEAGTMVSAVSV